MPPHIVRRAGQGSVFYLIDGRRVRRSLKTTNKGIAEHLLTEYIKEKYGLKKAERHSPTVKEYYEEWIKTKTEPLVRKSWIRDIKQHFCSYVLPAISTLRLTDVSMITLRDIRESLLQSGKSLKTCRNILDSSFRAMWRDALTEKLVTGNPFIELKWPRKIKHRPDPYTPEDCAKILAYFKEYEPFYHPFVLFLFSTGMRPSEAIALQWEDIDLENLQIEITKSRHLKCDGPPKTDGSARTIAISAQVAELLESLPSKTHGKAFVWMNKYGNQLDANNFARDYWGRGLMALGIRHRKFYQYKHTFITEALKRHELAEAVADYCGTSEQMIKDNYRGAISLSSASIMPQLSEKPLQDMASPTGFEPVAADALKCVKVLSMIEYEKLRAKKRA